MILKTDVLVEDPLVSIVIPSYNRIDTVGQTIDSILNQKCNFKFEIIIGDDNSTDGVRDLLLNYQKRYPSIFVLIFQETNIGLGANWATAVKLCRGKYLANCDNDDYWHNENKLQMQVDFMEIHIDCGVCHTYHRNFIKAKNKYIDHNYNYNDKISEPLHLAIFNIRGFECCNSSILYRKDVLDKYIELDDYIKYKFTLQDWNTWVVLAKYTKFCCLPISTTTILIDNTSITRNNNYQSIYQRMINEENTYRYVCSKYPDTLHYDENSYKIYTYVVLLRAAYNNIDIKNARYYTNKLNTLGYVSKKTKLTTNFILFYLFAVLKYIFKR